MKVVVPPPPLGEAEKTKQDRAAQPSSTRTGSPLASPLDAGFLGRTHLTTLWLGGLIALGVWGATRSAAVTLSFAGGALLGALLLKSQEIFVRRVLAPRAGVANGGWDARIPIAILLPLKYVAIGLAFGWLISRGWLHPVAFATGFLTEQIVIVSKVIGRFAAQRMRGSDEKQH